MRGHTRSLSLRRRLIVDLMHASASVPFVTLRRTLSIGSLIEARAGAARPPGWVAIFAKAFAIVASDAPALRTLYLKWPWQRLYELPHSIGTVAIARDDGGEASVLFQKVAHADAMPLAETDRAIRLAKTAPPEDIPYSRKLLAITALPLPLRRLLWGFAMNSGRQRANYAGSFGITSVSAISAGELHPLSPGPYLISYGVITAERTIDVVIRWDHRVADGAAVAAALTRLEAVLNDEIAAEIRARRPAPGAELIDRPGRSA